LKGVFQERLEYFFCGNDVYLGNGIRVCESRGGIRLELEADEPELEAHDSCGYSCTAKDVVVANNYLFEI